MLRRKQASNSAQALVEFALILLILLFIIFVVIESARLFQANLTVQNAARAAGRYAITGEFDASCLTNSPPCDDPRLESIKAVAHDALSGLQLDDTAGFGQEKFYLIEIFSVDDSGEWVADYAGEPGDPVLIRVTYQVGIITPIVRSIAQTVRVRGQVVYNNEAYHQRNLTSGTSPGSDEAPDLPPLPDYAPPNLEIAKSASTAEVNIPDPIIYTVTIENTGVGPASGVVFSDTLPSEVQYTSGAPGGCTTPTGPGGAISCSLGELMPGDNVSLVYSVASVAAGSATNTATVRSAEVGPASASTTTTILDPTAADVAVSKTAEVADGKVAFDQPFDYTITVSNLGPGPATNVVITDDLPDGLAFVGVTSGADITCTTVPAVGSSELLSCEIGSLAPGGSASMTLSAEAPAPGGYIYNTADVDAAEPDPVSDNNSATSQILAAGEADLSIVKTVSPERIAEGERMFYTLQVTNSGPNDATDVVVTEDMPEGVGLVSTTTPQGDCVEEPAVGIVCSLGTVSSSATIEIQIETIASLPGWRTNKASVGANEIDTDTSNNSDSVTTYIEPLADLAITKSGVPIAVYEGDLLTYTIEVTHDGGKDVPGALVTDQLSRDVVVERVEIMAGTGGSCSVDGDNNYVECVLDGMQSGDSSTIEIGVRPSVPNAEISDDLTNTTVVTSTYTPGVVDEHYRDSDLTNNEATVSTFIGPGLQTIALSPTCGSAEADTTVTVTGMNWTVSGGEPIELSIVPATGGDPVYIFPTSVPAAPSWTTQITIPPDLLAWGDYTIRASRKLDEVAEQTFTFPCPAPDLVVDSVTLVSKPAVLDETSTYRVVVRNQKTSHTTAAGAFNVGLYFDPVGVTATSTTIDPQYQIGTLSVNGLAIGGTVTLDFVVTNAFDGPGNHTVWAFADPEPPDYGTIDEIHDNNNTGNLPVLVLARPDAVDDGYSTAEDEPLSVPASGVLGNDSDADSAFSITSYDTSSANGGTLVLNGDGSFTYTPALDFNGDDTFTYEVCDADNLCDSATVTIRVDPVNDAPVAVDDSYTTDEDTVLNIAASGVLGNDTDVDGDSLNVASVNGNGTDVGQTITLASGALLRVNSDGSFSYDPNGQFEQLGPGESDQDSFTYTASDGTASSNVATVTITINGVNDAPVAVDNSYTVNEDAVLNIAAPGVLPGDSDAENDPLTAVLDNDVAHGTLALSSDGSFSYTPEANFNGSDIFTYTANDGTADSAPATVTISVNAVNDAPVARDNDYTVSEDGTLTAGAANGVLADDNDADGDVLTAVQVGAVSNGTLTFNSDGSFTYTPNADFYGSDSFTYRAHDGTVASNLATVTITVEPVNDAPVAVDDADSTDEDTPLTVGAPGVLANDTDVEGDGLTASVANAPSNGTLSLSADGSFTYMPDANFNGSDTFTYTANDSTADSAPATVTITVNAVNDAPQAQPDGYGTTIDTPLIVGASSGVLQNDGDVDGDTLTVSASDSTSSNGGSVSVLGDGSFTYTPASAFTGSDTFSYTISDGKGGGDSATVTITVVSANSPQVPARPATWWARIEGYR